MTKIKVLDLAREVGMEDDKLLLKLKRMGVKMKDKKSEEPEIPKPSSDERVIGRDAEKEIVEKRVKPTVIRRRTRNLEQKAEPVPQVEVPPPVEVPMAPPMEAEAEAQKKPFQKAGERVLEETIQSKEEMVGAKTLTKKKGDEPREVAPPAGVESVSKEAFPPKGRTKENRVSKGNPCSRNPSA
jgi:hypothetical protein